MEALQGIINYAQVLQDVLIDREVKVNDAQARELVWMQERLQVLTFREVPANGKG